MKSIEEIHQMAQKMVNEQSEDIRLYHKKANDAFGDIIKNRDKTMGFIRLMLCASLSTHRHTHDEELTRTWIDGALSIAIAHLTYKEWEAEQGRQ